MNVRVIGVPLKCTMDEAVRLLHQLVRLLLGHIRLTRQVIVRTRQTPLHRRVARLGLVHLLQVAEHLLPGVPLRVLPHHVCISQLVHVCTLRWCCPQCSSQEQGRASRSSACSRHCPRRTWRHTHCSHAGGDRSSCSKQASSGVCRSLCQLSCSRIFSCWQRTACISSRSSSHSVWRQHCTSHYRCCTLDTPSGCGNSHHDSNLCVLIDLVSLSRNSLLLEIIVEREHKSTLPAHQHDVIVVLSPTSPPSPRSGWSTA